MAPAGDQKHNMGAAGDQIQHIRRIRGLVVSRLQLFIGSGVQQVQAWLFRRLGDFQHASDGPGSAFYHRPHALFLNGG